MPKTRLRKWWDLEVLIKASDPRNSGSEKCDLDMLKYTKNAVAVPGRAQASHVLAKTPSHSASGCRPDWESHYPSFMGLCKGLTWDDGPWMVPSCPRDGSISDIFSTPPSDLEVLSANKPPPHPVMCTQMGDRW
jgi:hypothetical protein